MERDHESHRRKISPSQGGDREPYFLDISEISPGSVDLPGNLRGSPPDDHYGTKRLHDQADSLQDAKEEPSRVLFRTMVPGNKPSERTVAERWKFWGLILVGLMAFTVAVGGSVKF